MQNIDISKKIDKNLFNFNDIDNEFFNQASFLNKKFALHRKINNFRIIITQHLSFVALE